MRNTYFILFSLAFFPAIMQATIFVRGNGTQPLTFNQPVISKVFDRATGNLYVGLNNGASSFAISRVGRCPLNSSFITPKFTGIATSNIVTSRAINFLTLATNTGNTFPYIVGSTSLTPLRVFAISPDGLQSVESANLKDAANGPTVDGNTISGIFNVAANQNFIFSAVGPNNRTFGDPNSGIAVVRINLTEFSCTPTLASLVQTAAQLGDSGIKAALLDPTIDEVKTASTVNDPTILEDPVALFWDDPLQRLYIGLQIISGDTAADGAKSVVVGRVQSNGTLIFSPIGPDPNAGEFNHIVVVQNDTMTTNTLVARNLRVMHTSTGPSYLIVNGGNGGSTCSGSGDTAEFGNRIFALPLVDNPTNVALHGTLADGSSIPVTKDASLGTVRFVVPATNTTLPVDTDPAVVVGTAPFPLQPSECISDMVVLGDTVYVSSDLTQSTSNDSGILYSQAIFDNVGRIVRWTPWAKRSFPFLGIPGTTPSERIQFFDVDPVTGNVWAIGGDTNQTVALTQWDFGTDSSSLVSRVRAALFDGSTSVLDLDQGTQALGQQNPNRYALFGGVAKIVFARISRSFAASQPFDRSDLFLPTPIWAPQEVFQDFSDPENFLITTIPNNCDPITVLEFSRSDTAQLNYFFAGTYHGMFVFTTSTGMGFDVSSFAELNAAPFNSGIWQQAPNISGAIVDIKSAGQALYVLTFETSRQTPFKNTLYRIPFQPTLAAMFSPGNIFIIAQTNTSPVFESTSLFTGIQIINTGATPGDEDSKEQLVLATNTGLYRSNADQIAGDGIITAVNQTAANWIAIDPAPFSAVFGMDTPLPSTVWPMEIVDQANFKTFSRSSLNQLSGIGNSSGTMALFNTTFIPAQFNGSSSSPAFESIPATTYFFSDGARRFFIINSGNVPGSQIAVSPWNVQESNVQNPASYVLRSPALTTNAIFYWLHPIGVSGIVMAGTSQGVVGLE